MSVHHSEINLRETPCNSFLTFKNAYNAQATHINDMSHDILDFHISPPSTLSKLCKF